MTRSIDTNGCFLCDARAAVPDCPFHCIRCGARLERNGTVFVPQQQGDPSGSYPAEAGSQIGALEDDSFWFRHRNDVIADLVHRYPPDGPVLDVGGGNGFVSRRLEAEGFAVALVEPSPGSVATARERGLAHIVRARFRELGCVRNLQAVGLFDVLEHLEDPGGLLCAIGRGLAPNGLVYVTVPGHRWLWSAADDYAEHQGRYTRRGLRRLFRACGFEPVCETHFFAALVAPVLLFRTLPSILGLRLDTGVRSAEFVLPGLVQKGMSCVLGGERRLLRRLSLPAGSSIAAVFTRRSS